MVNVQMEIEFERSCFKCYGASRYLEKECTICNRTGYVSTELGDKLIEFLERQGFTRTQQRKDGEE
jgi:hypothetical protein